MSRSWGSSDFKSVSVMGLGSNSLNWESTSVTDEVGEERVELRMTLKFPILDATNLDKSFRRK